MQSAYPIPGQSPTTSRANVPASVVWVLFLIWTTIGFFVMPLGISVPEVYRRLDDGLVRRVILAVLPLSDAIWISLAAIIVYFHAAAEEGLVTARRWSLIILTGSTVAEWIGARTGFPFGPYRYTDNFGWRIGGVLPLAIPLAWLVILLSGRYLVLRLFPTVGRTALALGAATVAVLTDFNLEWVAWKVRKYWIWYPDHVGPPPAWPPAQNYLSWFTLAFCLTVALPPNYALSSSRTRSQRPITILILMNALFIVVWVTNWFWPITKR